MKKHLAVIFAMTAVMLVGCGDSGTVEEFTGADSQITVDTDTADTGGDEDAADAEEGPAWAKGERTEGTLFQNLNLDGVGDSDDEAYVAVYRFGDYEDKVTIINIRLGTGETVAQVFPVCGDCSLQVGRLISEEKDAIVLQVSDLTSNYGAATVYVLNISPAGADPIPSVGMLLDTSEPIALADGNIIDTSLFQNLVTGGTEVVDIEGMTRQGVLIYSVGEEDEYQGLPRIFYWTDRGWAVLPGELPDVSAANVWNREGAVKLPFEDAAVIAGLVESGTWAEGTSDCSNDCVLFMDGEELLYHSDCGTFNDAVKERNLHLTEE